MLIMAPTQLEDVYLKVRKMLNVIDSKSEWKVTKDETKEALIISKIQQNKSDNENVSSIKIEIYEVPGCFRDEAINSITKILIHDEGS